jgi:hypothetical protein
MPSRPTRSALKLRNLFRVVPCLLAVTLLASACATTEHGAGGGGGWVKEALPPRVEEAAREEAREAEAALAVARVWAVASGVREVGAQLSFTFWVENGALTLTGYGARGREARATRQVDGPTPREGLETVFTEYARRHTGEVRVVLFRDERGWAVDYDARGRAPRPPEARTLPLLRGGVPRETVEEVARGLGRLLKAVQVPAGGAATVELEAHLEDGRVEGWEPRGFEVTRRGEGGPPPTLSPWVTGEAIQVLLPFTSGFGPRTVRMRLALQHRMGEAQARGHVEWAEVVRPPPPPGLDEDFAAEYRAMHEDILRRWREETREGAEWVTRRGVEELALWYAGGILARGAGLFAAKAVPTVMRALGRGGEAAAGWLRSALLRMPPGEKKAFEQLWGKVQLEGEKALSQAERAELRGLTEGIEQLVRQPLGDAAKDRLRGSARRAYKELRPELKSFMQTHPTESPVHHRRPLEYAQLFPDYDINAAENLVMVRKAVHERINAIWNRFRTVRAHRATARDVERVTRTIDERFKGWYHRADEPTAVPYSLEDAEEAVLRELRRSFSGF